MVLHMATENLSSLVGLAVYHHPPMVQVGQRRSIIIHMEAGCQLHMVMVNLLWQAIVVVTI